MSEHNYVSLNKNHVKRAFWLYGTFIIVTNKPVYIV